MSPGDWVVNSDEVSRVEGVVLAVCEDTVLVLWKVRGTLPATWIDRASLWEIDPPRRVPSWFTEILDQIRMI